MNLEMFHMKVSFVLRISTLGGSGKIIGSLSTIAAASTFHRPRHGDNLAARENIGRYSS